MAAALAAVYLLWGGTFLAIRYAVAEVPPLATIAIRCLAGAALLFGWLAWRGERLSAGWAQWRVALLAGTFLFLGCHSLLAWVEQRVSSGEAALLMTGIPLWMVLFSAVIERRMPSTRVLAGLGVGVAGVGLLTAGASAGGSAADRLWLVLSALCWAVGSLLARHGARPPSLVHATAMQLMAGGAVVLGASALLGELAGWAPAETSPRAVLSLGFLVAGGTVVGFGAYAWLLQVTTPAAASSYAFVNPVVALLLAWVVGDGALTWRVVLAAGLVIGAVVLTWTAGASPGGRPVRQPQRGDAPPRSAPTAGDPPRARTRGAAAARAAGA